MIESHSTRRALAWTVHLYTALGLVLAAVATGLVVRGTEQSFRAAFGLLLLATLIGLGKHLHDFVLQLLQGYLELAEPEELSLHARHAALCYCCGQST